VPAGGERHRFHAGDETKFYCFEKSHGTSIMHVGVPYRNYRMHVHNFVVAGFITVLAIIGILFFFMKFVIFIGLTRPLKRLLAGVEEIRDGNLNHQIEISAQDEIGFISHQFNLMVHDLRISGENIRRSEQKFRELTSMLPDIVYETDLNLNVTYFNRAGLSITGFNEDDISKGLSLHALLDDDECRRLLTLLVGNTGENSYKIITHRIRKKNGKTIFGENNAAVIFERNEPVCIRGVIRDVTEKIQIENSLIQAQKMETIGILAGGIAHDFNNILTGITGTVSLIEHKMNRCENLKSGEVRSDLEVLKKSADRAANIVRQLLSLSKRQKPALERIDLNIVAKSVYEICNNSFDKKIKLNYVFLDAGAFVMADETQMGQVLLNLCVNARDSMTIMRPEGSDQSGELTVVLERLSSARHLQSRFVEALDRPYCRLRVGDTGVGMNEEIISRIFDPFFTTKQKEKGTGLGLAMVYNIVKQHGGFIDINSKVSFGSIVDVYIPADDSVSFKKNVEPDTIGLKACSGTVLLVDDDTIIQKTCGDMLKVLGYTLITAMDGQECIDMYRAHQNEIDAVILDVMMPVKSGNEAFDELRTINSDIRVLVTSGYREDPRIGEMLAKGARGFVQKPYTIEILSQEIFRVIKDK
jgi:PAS domain S-box-containing protein